MGINCSRSECNTTSGCAHRGPAGELCWFGTCGDPRDARIAELEAALRPFADAFRSFKGKDVARISLGAEPFARAAELVQ